MRNAVCHAFRNASRNTTPDPNPNPKGEGSNRSLLFSRNLKIVAALNPMTAFSGERFYASTRDTRISK